MFTVKTPRVCLLVALLLISGLRVAPARAQTVAAPKAELRPLYSPDGRRLAFISMRTGNGDIYVFDFASGELRRVTFDDGGEQLDAWSHDGKWLYYSSTARDIGASNDVYRVSPAGGTPM